MVDAAAALIGDYYEPEGHRYFLGGREVPGVTSVLKEAGVIDATFLRNREALARGSRVHSACEAIDLCRRAGLRTDATIVSDRLRPGEQGYADAYAAFVRDHAPKYSHVEVGLLHATLRFGGRPDRICAYLGGGPAILELKTGHPAPWHGVQLAAYQMLFPTGSRWVVYLRDDGRYAIRRMTGADDYQTFLSALDDYRRARGEVRL